jgi:hypothetical protein
VRRSHHGWITALFVAAAALAPDRAAGESGDLDLVSQDREVSVDIDIVEDFFSSCIPFLDPGCNPDSTTSTNFSGADSAPDAGPFVATANLPEFPATFANLDSEIGADGIRASGSHAATASFTNTGGFPITFHSEFHDVASRAVVTFQIDSSVPYSLTGSVTTGGAIFSTSSSYIRLTGPGGVIAQVRVDSDPDCTDPECFTVGPEPLSASGVLDPGTYTFEALASGTAGGAHDTNGSFGTGVNGSFDVELALAPPVPALPAGALVFLGLVLGAAGAAFGNAAKGSL